MASQEDDHRRGPGTIERLGAPALARRRAGVVCGLQRYSMDENKAASSLWLLSTFGGEPRRRRPGGEGRPAGLVARAASASPSSPSASSMARRTTRSSTSSRRRRRGTPRAEVAARHGILQVAAQRPGVVFVAWVWPGWGVRAQAQAKRLKAFRERKGERATSPPASRSTATGTHRCRWAACACHLLELGQRPRPRPVRGHAPRTHARRPRPPRTSTSARRPRMVFAFDPAPEKRPTAAARWPRSSCARAASPRSRRTPTGT